MSADVTEIIKLSVDVEKLANGIGAKTSQVVRKSALDLERHAKTRAPVDTGNLRNSIGVDVTGSGRAAEMYADVGPTADYGAYVEFGTRNQAPQPYMMPSADVIVPNFVAAVEAVMDL